MAINILVQTKKRVSVDFFSVFPEKEIEDRDLRSSKCWQDDACESHCKRLDWRGCGTRQRDTARNSQSYQKG